MASIQEELQQAELYLIKARAIFQHAKENYDQVKMQNTRTRRNLYIDQKSLLKAFGVNSLDNIDMRKCNRGGKLERMYNDVARKIHNIAHSELMAEKMGRMVTPKQESYDKCLNHSLSLYFKVV